MADWVLIPCLKTLFAEFDRLAPSRDKASDGAIGDLAHQQEVSDHNPDETGSVPIHDADHLNEVHAIDVDNNLNESDLTMETVVQFLLGRCRSGAERRLRYIIYNRRIWSASSGWVQKTYTGASAHTEHAHFSASYETDLEASTASWHLEDLNTMPTADEIAAAVWAHPLRNPYSNVDQAAGDLLRYAPSRTPILEVDKKVAAVQAAQATQSAQLTQLLGKDFTDEAAIAAGVLAGLTPEKLAAAITDAGLTPEALAAAIPDDLAERTIELLGEKLRPSA